MRQRISQMASRITLGMPLTIAAGILLGATLVPIGTALAIDLIRLELGSR